MSAPEVVRRRLPASIAPGLLEELHALERAAESRPWSRAALAEELVAPGRTWLVAELGGTTVALAGSVRLGDDVHVLRLTVEAAHRRRGLGGTLLDDLVDAARASGAASVTLEVRASNVAALALYRGRGFEERGRRPRYYADGEDALLLTRDLAPVVARGAIEEGD